MTSFIGIDLFCGAGGMSEGFRQSGIKIIAAVEADAINAETHKINFEDCKTICKDIQYISKDEILDNISPIKEIDVVFGGPPCQGFSVIGKRKPDDYRNFLLFEFARIVSELKPKYFVLENVQGLLFKESRPYIEKFFEIMSSSGYSVAPPLLLNAQNFGVPQRRKRAFIIGHLPNLTKPNLDLLRRQETQAPTVWEAIGDLPNIEDYEYLLTQDTYTGKLSKSCSDYAAILRGDLPDPITNIYHKKTDQIGLSGCLRTNHHADIRKRFSETLPGSIEPISRFYRLSPTGVSPTLRAGSDRSHGTYTAPRPIHPIYARCISVREAARLHSFPDYFQFHPTKYNGYRQIGNSVPPLLARAVANTIIAALRENGEK